MGLELLDRPVFRASVAKFAEILKSIGYDCDPVGEVAKGIKEKG